MFRSYYGLAFNPFDKQMASEKDRFLSKDISEMLSRLDYLKDTRGIGLFTARPGMGKSFALRCFAKSLNPNLYHMQYLCLSTVSVMEFYRQFCSTLGIEPKGGKPGMFRAIQEQVLYLYRKKKQPLLLAIDEAQYLSTGILEAKLRSVDVELTSTSLPGGINMGITCASPIMISGANCLISPISSGMRNGSAA